MAMHMGFGLKRADDPPLYARKIKRVRKGVYEIALYVDAKCKREYHGDTRFHADSVAHAMAQCKRLYPTVTRRVR